MSDSEEPKDKGLKGLVRVFIALDGNPRPTVRFSGISLLKKDTDKIDYGF